MIFYVNTSKNSVLLEYKRGNKSFVGVDYTHPFIITYSVIIRGGSGDLSGRMWWGGVGIRKYSEYMITSLQSEVCVLN